LKVLFLAKGQETLAIEYLSASLKKAGHQVDLLFDPDLDGSMGFLNSSFLNWLSSKEMWTEAIRKISPDLIAMSCPLNMYPFVKDTARSIKQFSNIPIVVGGGHATLAPQYLLENGDIDCVCIGEGEEAMVELADKMERGVDYTDTRNFWFRRNGTIISNPVRPLLEDLDSLPFPDRDLFRRFGCFAGNLYFVAGRGCPFQCTYCCQHAFHKTYKGKGTYVRFRSVENVIQELEECVKRYDAKHIHSEDDTFTINHGWLLDFCNEYRKRIGVPLYCHVRPGTLSEEIVKKLEEAGCKGVFFGIDSGNEHTRKVLLKRNIADQVIYEQARLIKRSGIKLSSASMFSLPGETPQQMLDTFKMAGDVKSDYAYATIFYPFYGTELYQYAVDKGYLSEENTKKVKEGLGSPYQYPLLENPHNDLAMILKNVLPAYIRFKFLRSIINVVVKNRWLKASQILNLALTPFAYAHLGQLKRREIMKTVLTFLKYRFGFAPLDRLINSHETSARTK
jgi:radical SAM superfamily enzyme YgiQ (UPF0313 family)